MEHGAHYSNEVLQSHDAGSENCFGHDRAANPVRMEGSLLRGVYKTAVDKARTEMALNALLSGGFNVGDLVSDVDGFGFGGGFGAAGEELGLREQCDVARAG